MLQISRNLVMTDRVDVTGAPYVLVAEQLAVAFGAPGAALGASYRRPRALIRRGRVTPITDYVMLVRLVALLVVTVATFIGTARR